MREKYLFYFGSTRRKAEVRISSYNRNGFGGTSKQMLEKLTQFQKY